MMAAKDNHFERGLSSLGLFIAVAVLGAAYLLAEAMVEIKSSRQTIRVKGFAEQRIRSDLAVWTGTYGTQSTDLVSAYRKLKADREKVVRFLKGQGIQDSGIDIQPVITITQYSRDAKGYQTNTIEGYRLSQTVRVTSNDIERITRISKESSQLIEEGIGFESHPPSYLYTKLNDLKISLLETATRDAKKRAEALAKNSGAKVGVLRSASQGVFQITAPNDTDVSDYGISDTSTIEKAVKAVVTMEFAIR